MYYNPVKVIETDSWQNELGKCLKALRITKPLIVTTKGNINRNLQPISLGEYNIFSDINNYPTMQSCQKAINFAQTVEWDGIVAIGGGSVMDTAKVMLAAIGTHIYNIKDLLQYSDKYEFRIPSIFIPTTHGTASEVTMWGTIWNKEEKQKYSIYHVDLYPDIAILDAQLTLSKGLELSISTTLDALSHSFETLWNKNSNIKSIDYAISSIKIILEEVPKLKQNPNDIVVRKKLLRASNLAGLAFSNTRTAAAHSISYPLTFLFDIPHGIACSIPIIPLLRINRNAMEDVLGELLKSLNYNYEELERNIQNIPKGVVNFKLSDWGVNNNHIPEIVEKSFSKSRIDNNIINLTKQDVSELINQLI